MAGAQGSCASQSREAWAAPVGAGCGVSTARETGGPGSPAGGRPVLFPTTRWDRLQRRGPGRGRRLGDDT